MKEKLSKEEKIAKRKEYLKEYQKKYRQSEKYLELQKSEKRKEYIKEYSKSDKKREYDKEYKKKKRAEKKNIIPNKNIEKKVKSKKVVSNKDYQKNYRENNKEKNNLRKKERRTNDPLFRLQGNIQALINFTIKRNGYKKESKTHEILGCYFEQLKIYLENQFIYWMSWKNYGNPVDGLIEPNKTWDIDHIIPLSSATNEQELLELCKYTNLQPLCSYENRFVKRDNL